MENVIRDGLQDAIKIDDKLVTNHLNEIVLETVEQTLNGLLDAEANRLCGAERYQRSEHRLVEQVHMNGSYIPRLEK
jgi:putative transposase